MVFVCLNVYSAVQKNGERIHYAILEMGYFVFNDILIWKTKKCEQMDKH